MIQRSFTKGSKTIVLSTGAAAGTTAVNATAVDMLGYEAVRAMVLLGTLTATQVTSLKAQGSNTNNGSDWVDLGGTKVGPAADADGGKLLILDLYRPAYRYILFVVSRGTANAVISSIIGEVYVAANEPVAKVATVAAQTIIPYATDGTP